MSELPSRTVTVRTVDGDKEVEALVFGHFGVHESIDMPGFTVTHLPSGRAAGQGFPFPESAIRAMRAISAVRKDWDTLTDLTDAQKQRVISIIEQNRGGFDGAADGEPFRRPELNGYRLADASAGDAS